MSGESGKPRKAVKTLLRIGGGRRPGYRWNVEALATALDDAAGFLDRGRRRHLADKFRILARLDEPSRGGGEADVRPVEDFFELRDKGGTLGRLNVRVFFHLHKPTRTIAILAAIHKQNDGATPMEDKLRVRKRRRDYLELVASGRPGRTGREG